MALAFALIGLTSLIGQIVLLRELFVVFYGNELSVGAILAGWLGWVAVGSWLLPRMSLRAISAKQSPTRESGIASSRSFDSATKTAAPLRTLLAMTESTSASIRVCPRRLFAILQAATLIVLPLQLFLVSNIRAWAGAIPGEILGFFPMLAWSLVALAPLCLLLGWQFTTACQVAAPRFSPGQVYLFESLGAVAGGLLASFILLERFDAWQIALALAWVNVLSATLLLGRRQMRTNADNLQNDPCSSAFVRVLFFIIFVAGLTLLPALATNLRAVSLAQLWRGFTLVESRDSIYGNLAVTTRGAQFAFFENGLLLATTEDFLAAEETAHYALLQQTNPARVLLIGGGVNGTLREILKHPVAHVDYVELDPTLVATARKYLPEPDRRALDDPRVTIHNVDGRLFVREQIARGEKYAVVLQSVPHPFTAQINRMYTREFFAEARQILRDDGVFALTLISNENAASREMQNLDASVDRALREVFADVLILPGDDALLLASPRANVLTRDIKTLARRWTQRKLQTTLATPSHLEQRLNEERIEYARQVFGRAAPVNRDFEPVGLYFDLTLWASYWSASLRDAMNAAMQLQTWWFVPLLIVVGAGALAFARSARRSRHAIVWTLAALGFAGMVWQVVVIFAFQILHGYVYHEIALMMTAFMAGLAVGSAWATRARATIRGLIVIEIGAVIFSLLLPLALIAMQNASSAPSILLPALIGVSGLLVGAAFPLATRFVEDAAGALYAADLLGASVGALLAGALLIPILGLSQTMLAVASLNLFALGLLIIEK